MKTTVATTLLALTATVSVAQDYSNVTSGMLLGIYGNETQQGMRVTSTIPGYSAVGRLQPGDVLQRATVDGNTMYYLRSHYEMECTKMAIGANRDAAIEIYRPGYGLIYAWVQFTPLSGPAAATTASGKKQYGASFKLESEKPGARSMFRRSNSGGGSRPKFSNSKVKVSPPSHTGPRPGGNSGAAKLFGNR
ncbi:hypothetical protein [Fuerstiella marisgermanici]|uniref:Uncharacterized protein n=1 Tax=Fuerstiella marisgermanici TaxID=1891926 RepID=A0A1P8WIM5_9PLAN|nr:hypothetical protein [Fuerstiella marisgermanici]APZ93897.1 hypothetical protein Fuma_03515 [Fuerstiella marisgermanici]